MNTRLLLLIPFIITSGLLLLVPRLSPGHLFFGVRVGDGFRATEVARRALRWYQLATGASAALGIVWILLGPEGLATVLWPPLVLSGVTIAAGVRNYRRLVSYQVAAPTVAGVELTTALDRLPRYFWLASIPPLMLISAAAYLHLHWAEIPARHPIHWGADGKPNGWLDRSVLGVYGPLIFGGMWMAWFVAMALAVWFGSRRMPQREAMAKTMIAAEFLFGMVWPMAATLALNRPGNVSLFVILVGVLGVIVFSVVTFVRAGRRMDSSGVGMGPWMAAGSYDSNDESILVLRRDGLGYAPNFARPMAWLLMGAPAVIVFVGLKWLV